MPPKFFNFRASGALLALAAAASLASPLAQAQQVFRIVGPDGKVTFSDRAPPPSTNHAKASETGAGASASAVATTGTTAAGLPFELRQVALKYPVTLYTGESCAPCGAARSMLTSRGIPFNEKTVNTGEDAQALKRLSGDTSLPFLTIGAQQLKGFSDAEWTQFLNAAGYPARSVLTVSYRLPAPTPLVAQVTAAPAAASPASEATTEVTPANTRPAMRSPEPKGNPAGIRF